MNVFSNFYTLLLKPRLQTVGGIANVLVVICLSFWLLKSLITWFTWCWVLINYLVNFIAWSIDDLRRWALTPVKTSHGYCAQERMAMIIFSRCQDSADTWVLGYTCSAFDVIMISQHSFASNSHEKYYGKEVFCILLWICRIVGCQNIHINECKDVEVKLFWALTQTFIKPIFIIIVL